MNVKTFVLVVPVDLPSCDQMWYFPGEIHARRLTHLVGYFDVRAKYTQSTANCMHITWVFLELQFAEKRAQKR